MLGEPKIIRAADARQITERTIRDAKEHEQQKRENIASIRDHNGRFWVEENGDYILGLIKKAAESGEYQFSYEHRMIDLREWREIAHYLAAFLREKGYIVTSYGQTSMARWGVSIRWDGTGSNATQCS